MNKAGEESKEQSYLCLLTSQSKLGNMNPGGRGNRPKQAHHKVVARRSIYSWHIVDDTWLNAQQRLLEEWSSEQISKHAYIEKDLDSKHRIKYSSSQALHLKLELKFDKCKPARLFKQSQHNLNKHLAGTKRVKLYGNQH